MGLGKPTVVSDTKKVDEERAKNVKLNTRFPYIAWTTEYAGRKLRLIVDESKPGYDRFVLEYSDEDDALGVPRWKPSNRDTPMTDIFLRAMCTTLASNFKAGREPIAKTLANTIVK